MNPVGKPDAGNRHVRFDERGEETERCRMAQVTAPLLDSTRFIRATAKRGSERNYSSFFGSFDMRSRRSCMSFIWRRRSSILSSSGAGSGTFSDSVVLAPGRGGTNGLNIENVC